MAMKTVVVVVAATMTTTSLAKILGGLLLVTLMLAGRAVAVFTNSFDDVTAGKTLNLQWDEVPAHYYPLCITARLVERGQDGHTATAYRANVTRMLSGTVLPASASHADSHFQSA